MKIRRWEDIKREKLSAERIEEIRKQVQDEVVEMSLALLDKVPDHEPDAADDRMPGRPARSARATRR